VSTLGIALMLAGAALAAAEAHVQFHGLLGAAAAVAAGSGVALVVAGAGAGIAVALAVGVCLALLAAAYALLVLRKGVAATRRRVRSGPEGLIGQLGEARASGQVFLDGALWRARLWAGDEAPALERGEPIVVERVDGLTLTVRRAEEWEVAP
jgi:membrane-bound serine protease (ClpP class)